jgi:hypothetical protein
MMQAQFIQKMEIRFWDQAIPLMSTSRPVQKLIRETYKLTHDRKLIPWIPAALVFSAGFGLGLGYLIGMSGLILH